MSCKLGETNSKRGTPVLALVGLPNCGKTSLYNALTGERQEVANWPGVTVEKRTHCSRYPRPRAVVVDLPGGHDLRGLTGTGAVAGDYVLSGQADAIISVVDASDLERHLQFTLLLLEAALAPVVVALNITDRTAMRGRRVDAAVLSRLLGVPVVETKATTGEGSQALLARAIEVAASTAAGHSPTARRIDYGEEVELLLAGLERRLETPARASSARWLTIRLLAGDHEVAAQLGDPQRRQEIIRAATRAAESLRLKGHDLGTHLVRRRFEVALDLAQACVLRPAGPGGLAHDGGLPSHGLSVSDRLDCVVTHRWLGLPILLGVMWVIFKFTLALGAPLTDAVGWGLEALAKSMEALGPFTGAARLAVSFATDGLLAGVGSVLAFFPPVLLLFVAMAVLEESGYMARASCVADKFMRALGLPGQAFIPLVIGFGCNVAAILATRVLENRRDRLLTILVSPLMSCSARLPIYVLFAGAFFSAHQGLAVFALYALGLVLAMALTAVVSRRLLRGHSSELVLELPPYRWPSARVVWRQAWARCWAFLRKAGTVIAAGVVIMWVLASLPWGVAYASQGSLLGRLGALVAPVLEPAGLGRWEVAVALLFGLLAKEFVIAGLGLVHGAGDAGLPVLLQSHFTPLTACSFMILALLYSPCLPTLVAIRKETGSWKWSIFAVAYGLALGLGLATAVFQIGRWLL